MNPEDCDVQAEPDWRVVLLAAMGLDDPADIDPDDQDTWERAYGVWMMHDGERRLRAEAGAALRPLLEEITGGPVDPLCPATAQRALALWRGTDARKADDVGTPGR